jgi:hypothetical protein
MTVDDFRRIALSLPEAAESAHMGHPDFRVRKKVFATIWPDKEWGMVKLTPEQQGMFQQAEPAVLVPVHGGWGRTGATTVRLASANSKTVRTALVTARRNLAPKRLAETFEEPDRIRDALAPRRTSERKDVKRVQAPLDQVLRVRRNTAS